MLLDETWPLEEITPNEVLGVGGANAEHE